MRKEKLRTIYLVLFFSAFFLQVQPCLSITPDSDVDSSKTSSRIAVAAVGDNVTSVISMRAGRTPYYLLFDMNGVFLKSIKNSSRNRGSRVSSWIVDFLKKESVKIVIAGMFGDKMQSQLEANHIEYHERAGIVKETVEKFIKNKRSKNAQK